MSTSVAYEWFYLGKLRDASNDVPHRRYLARLLNSSAAIAKFFAFGTSNLPPSKEGGQGDCGRANQTDACEERMVSLGRQPFIRPCLIPVRLG